MSSSKISKEQVNQLNSQVKNDELLKKYLSFTTCDKNGQMQIADHWDNYSDKLKNILIEYQISDIKHLELLNKYIITNVTLPSYIYSTKVLLRDYFITVDINNYMQQLPVREEFILRLRTNTFTAYDKDIKEEYESNNYIIDYELNITKDDILNNRVKKITHLTLLHDLIIENVHIGYTRKNKFTKLYEKLIISTDTAKLEQNIENICNLLFDIKRKLQEQNDLIIQISKYIDDIEPRVYSLEECAKFYNVSRERIRQIENKALNKLKYKFLDNENPETDYLYSFDYNATREELQKYAQLHPVVYLMVKQNIKKPFNEFFTDYNLIDLEIFNDYLEENNLVYFEHNYYKKTQASIFNYWITENLHRPFNVAGIELHYTQFLHDNNLEEFSQFDKRTTEGLLERNVDIVKSHGLYHTINTKQKEQALNYFNQIIDTLPEVFSTKLVYNMNIKLFTKADIKDYYELHNFLKKNNQIKDLKFKRVPHIFKGDATLQNYLEKNLKKAPDGTYNIEQLADKTGIAVETLLNVKSATLT